MDNSCSRDGRWRWSRSCCHWGGGDDPGEQWPSQPLLKDQSGEVSRGHGCDGITLGELLLGYEGRYVSGAKETS